MSNKFHKKFRKIYRQQQTLIVAGDLEKLFKKTYIMKNIFLAISAVECFIIIIGVVVWRT